MFMHLNAVVYLPNKDPMSRLWAFWKFDVSRKVWVNVSMFSVLAPRKIERLQVDVITDLINITLEQK
jgi:hypothetical protein